MIRVLRAANTALILGLVTAASLAQTPAWPSRSITIVAPAPAGGLTDQLARTLAHQLQQQTAQPIVVDNRPGMSGAVGTVQVAKGSADGSLLMITNAGTHAIMPFMVGNVGFDTMKDFTHLAMLGGSAWALVVAADSPHLNFTEWLVWAQAQSQSVTIGTPGDGSHGHLIGETLARARSIQWSHVPYKGAANVLADVVGGHVQAGWVTTSSAIPLTRSGRLRTLLVTSPRRLPDFPGVPTAREAGVPMLTAFIWFGLAAPHGMDAATRTAIQRAVGKAMATADWRDHMVAVDIEPVDVPPEQTEAFVGAEVQRWAPLARSLAASRPASSQRP